MPLNEMSLKFSSIGGAEYVEKIIALKEKFEGTNIELGTLADGISPDDVDRRVIITNAGDLPDEDLFDVIREIKQVMSCD